MDLWANMWLPGLSYVSNYQGLALVSPGVVTPLPIILVVVALFVLLAKIHTVHTRLLEIGWVDIDDKILL